LNVKISNSRFVRRIVRDYEKYIARQFKRGASRQELNVSWLKKNELELRRHVTELRNSVRNNWSTTGQELSKELRQFWQPSRPASPARGFGLDVPRSAGATSPGGALAHLQHLDIPGRPESPGAVARNDEFEKGYSLGLIGGVRSWVCLSPISPHIMVCVFVLTDTLQMMGGRTSLRDSQDSQPPSPEGSDEDPSKSPDSEDGAPAARGRKGVSSSSVDAMED